MLSLYIKNIIFLILQPGIVVGVIPYVLVKEQLKLAIQKDFSLLTYSAILLMLLGLVVVLSCVYHFIIYGRGTLSPVDRTKALVIKGLYKYTRNPMYVGILLILLGEVLFLKSIVLLGYLLLVFIAFNVFVIYIEEPRLRKDFETDYLDYTKTVKRWF